MELEIIPKKHVEVTFDPKAICVKHIAYYPSDDGEYEEEEITESLISKILEEIPEGIEINLSLIPYGEDDNLEVLCDREWLALAYSSDNDCYYSYNAQFAGTEEWSPLESGGQSPVEKYLAIMDIEEGVKAVEYFIRTGKLYPGIDWAHQLD